MPKPPRIEPKPTLPKIFIPHVTFSSPELAISTATVEVRIHRLERGKAPKVTNAPLLDWYSDFAVRNRVPRSNDRNRRKELLKGHVKVAKFALAQDPRVPPAIRDETLEGWCGDGRKRPRFGQRH